MRTVLLIRHGESLSNVGLPTSCAETVPLTELGKEQAKCISEYLKSQSSLDLIVISSYLRAQQTAEPTILSFPFVPQEEWLVHEFTFLSLNPNRTSTADERRPFVKKYWETSNPLRAHGPGAESFEQFIKRARKAMKCLRKSLKTTRSSFLERVCAALRQFFRQPVKYTKHDTIAIFSHQQFICALLWLSKRGPVNLSRKKTMQEFKDFLDANPLPNGAIVRVRFGDSHEPWQYEIITSHLEELERQKNGSLLLQGS